MVRILLKFLRTYIYIYIYIYIYFVALTVLPLFTLSSESGNIPPILVEFQHTEAVLLLLCEFHLQSFSIQKSPSLAFSSSLFSFSHCVYKDAFLNQI